MPNWCENYLSIEGSCNTLKEVLSLMKSDENAFDFERILPMPDNIYRGIIGVKESALYGENNWYDWSIKNWGTKWNSDNAEVYDNEILFLTAWSPCDPVIAALAEMFPTMRFTYTFYEPGMCFCGKRVYENGEMIFYYDGDYEENPLCEENDELAIEYAIVDTRFPIKTCGFNESVDVEECDGTFVHGKLYFREYENNMIYRKTDGMFIASKSYAFNFADSQIIFGHQAA